MGVGMPADIYLKQFGQVIYDAFGEVAYHVGSSLRRKRGWRDVDVRILMDDKTYAAMGFGEPDRPQDSAKWVALTLAFTALGRQMTGLPIDFQIQQRTYANETFKDQSRGAIIPLWTIREAKPSAL
jgi:hypothetical protein